MQLGVIAIVFKLIIVSMLMLLALVLISGLTVLKITLLTASC